MSWAQALRALVAFASVSAFFEISTILIDGSFIFDLADILRVSPTLLDARIAVLKVPGD